MNCEKLLWGCLKLNWLKESLSTKSLFHLICLEIQLQLSALQFNITYGIKCNFVRYVLISVTRERCMCVFVLTPHESLSVWDCHHIYSHLLFFPSACMHTFLLCDSLPHSHTCSVARFIGKNSQNESVYSLFLLLHHLNLLAVFHLFCMFSHVCSC